MDRRVSAIQTLVDRRFNPPMLKSLILLGATFTMGLAAGVFALYAHTIMPALKTTDDRTFVASFQALPICSKKRAPWKKSRYWRLNGSSAISERQLAETIRPAPSIAGEKHSTH